MTTTSNQTMQYRTGFGDETLEIECGGAVYTDPATGAQYSELSDCVRDQMVAYIRAGGDDPAEFEGEIEAAVVRATADFD